VLLQVARCAVRYVWVSSGLIAEPSSASTAWIAGLALALRRHAACTSRFGGRRSGREDVLTLRRILGVAGALVLLYIGVRSLRSAFRAKAAEDEKPDNVTLRPLAAFRMALAATASNPATIGYWPLPSPLPRRQT
jgi:threonine/homoserine/homoserine lactone efflux protein